MRAQTLPVVLTLALGLTWLGGCGAALNSGTETPPGAAAEAAGGSTDDRLDGERPAGEPVPRIENPALADIMAPGPLPERIMGRPDAPVTLIEYASLTCPYCRAFHDKALPEIKRLYIDKGQVRLIVREFPIGRSAGAATLVNRCIRDEKYFPLLHRFLMEQRAWVSQEVRRDAIFEIAKKEGMGRPEFDACFDSQPTIAGLKWVKERGRQLGVVGTPTFFVQDVKLRTSPSLDEIKRAIDAALQRPAQVGAAPAAR